MRPLRLELEGFTAFRDRISLDLTDLDLFAITGPTGAGKSSLIDAITYALYGRVPRVANRIESCIAQGLPRMYVQLEFAAGNGRHRIFREVRRQGRGNVRMERMGQDAWEAVEERATGIDERVKRLLGLDFDGFTRSVILPQGQFQEFLAGSPDKRREVLRGLLRLEVYERVRARASEMERGRRQEIADIEKRLKEDYAEALPENLTALEERLQDLRDETSALAEDVEALDRAVLLARDLATARAEYARARAEYQRAEAGLAEAKEVADRGAADIEEAKVGVEQIATRLASNSFDAVLFARLTGAAKLAQQIGEMDRDTARTDEALAKLEEAERLARLGAANATELLRECEHARRAAEEDLRQAERHNAAAAVREGLAPGDTCPVCGSVVATLPAVECPDLNRAHSAVGKARQEEDGARQTTSRAGSEVARAEANTKTYRSRAEEMKAHRAALETQLGAEWPEGEARSAAAVQEALKAQADAHLELDDLKKREQLARAELERRQKVINEATISVAQLRAKADAAKQSTDEAFATGRATADALVALVHTRPWPDVADRVPNEDMRPILEGRLDAGRTGLAQRQKDLGSLGQRILQLQEQIEKRRALEDSLKTVRGRHDVASDLAQVLRADRFQAFVQGEALRLLAAEGSRRLATLSGGRYTLAVAANSQDFDVVDQWNADQARSVRTLSGGETFLASLALALALAEALPSLAASRDVALDSIFLDEGFGSLDPEALERAAEALDTLRASNRMVCVVTHLKELADRLPARVVVQKSETGSTIEVL